MTREEVEVQFTGLAHDHIMFDKQQPTATLTPKTNMNNQMNNSPPQHQQEHNASTLSTIAILRRHPMYDSLVLVKKYRACLGGYTLEFPTNYTTTSSTTGNTNNNSNSKTTNGSEEKEQQQQVAKECCTTKLVSLYLDGDDPIYQCQESKCKNSGLSSDGEIVYVPMNGLLTRLDTYEKHGISIDSRVYAFAMGLKTAEKFLQSSSMKELQETPPL